MLVLGKFESFIESVAEEYIYKLNCLDLRPEQIPDRIRYHHTIRALKELDLNQYRHRESDFKNAFKEIAKIWTGSESLKTIEIETKFSFGKHGEKELAKLFERIGIAEIFNVIPITEEIETVSADKPVVRQVDFRGIFNTVCHYRNNILHEDASPSLNTDEITQFQKYFEQFAVKLDSYLTGMLPKPELECYI